MDVQQLLTGWGRTAASLATVKSVGVEQLAELDVGARGAIARGLGRAYGDPAQNGGGIVIRIKPSANPVWIDSRAGTATVDAGVSFDELLRRIVPHGFFVPVTPGTRFITVGGAIASDVHGKGHHTDLTFGHHVRSLDIVLADGTEHTVGPTAEPDLFWATVGGMGLTGVITRATFDLLRIETNRCLVETQRLADLDALIAAMSDGDADHRYSVAWIDLATKGPTLGRSILERGDHATLDDLAEYAPKALRDPLGFAPGSLASVPPVPNVMSRLAVRTFNELWFRTAPKQHLGTQTLTGFFHPLDAIGDWNRFYGARGFLQYQFVVPFEAADTLREIVERIVANGNASVISVLKRFGAESGGLLSFPKPGWTLTFDVAAGVPGLGSFLAELDQLVVGAGGRHYLAKDAHTTPDIIRAGYPRLDDWKTIRRSVDPHGRWASDQARRLDLL
ncbi:MAG: FAD-binding oxidoreductase [Ilumatobacter sp.]|nr:FAD-binding oxidoreductase [Ilumatobacter sp.]